MKRFNPARLLKEASSASSKAYCPYSRYRVGAALLTPDGTIFRGCNVENASYGLTLCAERVALALAVAAGHRKLKALAVVGGGRAFPMPCGACRQVLAEFCGPAFPIYIARPDRLSNFRTFRLGNLLPNAFKI